MENSNLISRRLAVKSSLFGIIAVSLPSLVHSKKNLAIYDDEKPLNSNFNSRYPAIDEQIVSEVVGVSHFNLDRLKELVNPRPELARATWDWGFGDWETAIGAASHVGRKDIVEFLISKGARPDIFTFAMLGSFETVKSMITFSPGLQSVLGPHGISLLQHAKNGISETNNKEKSNQLIDYLESLGDADGQKYDAISDADKQKYIGDYIYGNQPGDGFSVKLNMKKNITLGKIGKFGGALLKIEGNKYIYNGTTSVQVSFQFENEKVVSLTVQEPNLTLVARKL